MSRNIPKVITEDLGKILERAICYTYNIPYDGLYKYSEERARELSVRLLPLKELFAPTCTHSAKGGGQYDFTFTDEDGIQRYLSAKSVKKTTRSSKIGKVAPQFIGQPSISKFADNIGCLETEVAVRDCVRYFPKKVLALMEKYTFECPILYYNESCDKILYIKRIREIQWDDFTYDFTQDWTVSGKNSTTIKVCRGDSTKKISVAEIQIHNKSRKNMALRWYFDTIIELFKDDFHIVTL